MVANNVRAWRNHLGMKQHVVADELGVRREWYVKLENGQVRFKVDQLLIIARVLEVAPEEFLKEKVDFNQQKSTPPLENEHKLEQVVEKKFAQLVGKLLEDIKTLT